MLYNEEIDNFERMDYMYKIYNKLEVTENDTEKAIIGKIAVRAVVGTTVLVASYTIGIKVLEYVIL